MKKFWKTAVALLAVGVIGIGATACSFELEKPEWLDQALCDHVFDEKIVLSEATCEDAGELMKICSDCGKTKTVAIKKLPHVDEDGDNRCDACDRKMESGDEDVGGEEGPDDPATLVEVRVNKGEAVAGYWYRIYFDKEDGNMRFLYFDGIEDPYFYVSSYSDNNRYLWYTPAGTGPSYYLSGATVNITEDYFEIYLSEGTYSIFSYSHEDTGGVLVIDETTVIGDRTTFDSVYRLVPQE